MPSLTRKEQDVLVDFRSQLYEEGILRDTDTIGADDHTLIRFLRARRFNLRQAKILFKQTQEWRATVEGVGIDRLYQEMDPFDFPERDAVFEYWPNCFHKTDKRGRPVNIHALGQVDVPRMYTKITPERHWRSLVVSCESLTREVLPGACRAAGRHVENILIIIDLKGFALSQFWQLKSLARNCFQISQDYYPETMGQLAIVNAPASFTMIFGMIRPWLAKETCEKVYVLGSDYRDVLLSLVDEENLPESLGGKCTCKGKGGCYKSAAGPWMDGRKGWGPKARPRASSRSNPAW
ncbi:CRAL/TRIO domain-containing protein [Cylindrobasidium torrendii FP15055 ss-10]|uniref:CRAL/TRIO domain-containing protein n=1 Tax=Cylindrobasidium torrendii FP15055 ss-10 TaxID=1314674 RepID=A0A0D7BFZ0_9AGAR|nr:CRAL/TRIO domain-containing protein [Cylindrobasidium torrendii FP15055 ss-10]